MTYLVENEQAALVIPARLLARVHPHFREVQQLLAVQAADEARHMEVFTRRALAARRGMGTLLGGWTGVAHDAAGRAGFLAGLVPAVGAGRGQLPVAARLPRRPRARPDHPRRSPGWRGSTRPATSRSGSRTSSTRRALDPTLRGKLRAAVERRHDALVDTAGPQRRRLRRPRGPRRRGVDARRDRPRLPRRRRTSTTRWTRAAGIGSPASASRPTRRPSCPRCTRATSCEEFELVPYWYPTTAHLHCIQPTGGRMIWFAIALVLFACGGVALWLSRAPRRPEPRPIPHDEPENLFEPRSSREDPSP